MTDFNLKAHQYKRMLEERRGNNFEYWNDKKHYKMLQEGYILYEFGEIRRGWNIIQLKTSTSSVIEAKRVVKRLRNDGNYARIVCGYEKNTQRIKMFSIIFKPKNKS